MTIARQSTARTIIVGPILDADGVAVTDVAVGDLLISKNGATGAALNGSATLTHRHTGHYSLALTVSDTDTVGEVVVYINDGTNAMSAARVTIMEEAPYDALFAASAVGPLLANSDGAGLTEAGGTGDHLTALGTAAELAKVPKSDSNVTWNATAAAQIQGEANDALVAYDPPTNAELTAAVANVSVGEIQASALADLFNTDSGTDYASAVSGSVVKEIADNAGGSSLTAADIADAVWEEAIADHSGTAGSTAEQLAAAGAAGDPWATALPGSYSAGQAGKIVGDNLNATVSSRASQSSVDDLPTNAELATALDPLPTAAENATAVWGAGARTLTALDEDSTTLDLDATIRAAVGLASANLDTQIGDLPTNSELSTALGSADDAVLAAIAGLNDLSSAEAQSATAAALTAYDPPTRAELTSDINSVLSAVGDVPTTAEIWAAGTRTLTGIDEDTTTLDLDATIRGALGMASANLDTQLGDLPTAGENADAVLDEVVEGTTTLRQSVRLANAALGGKASGLETTEAKYRDLADTKDRITATVDSDGNRTAVSRDLT